jgi:hypothetical protein
MTSFNDMLASVQNVYASRHEPERLRPLTILYWRVLLISAGVFGILILVGGVWQFYAVITALNAVDSGVRAPAPALNRASLDELLTRYEVRAQSFEAIKISPPRAEDPSRPR